MASKGSLGSGEAARVAVLYELDLLRPQALPDLDRLVRLAADVCSAELALVSVFDVRKSVQVSVAGGEPVTLLRNETICDATLAKKSSLLIPDTTADPRSVSSAFVVGPPHIRSYGGVPVGPSTDLPVGVICIGHSEPGRFGPVEVARLERIAELVNAFLAERLALRRAERAAVQTEKERARQLQFDLIFDAISDGVNVYAPDGRCIETNPAGCAILGLQREQLLGRSVIDPAWRIVGSDGAPLAPDAFPISRAFRTGQAVRGVTLGVDLPEGGRRWISVNAQPVRNPETDAIEYGVVTFKDITQEREAESELSLRNSRLMAALGEAEKASRAKSDFISVMSHELRTPMNAVLGCAQLLSQSSLGAVQTRTLGVLTDAGRQMLALLNDLFDLSSLDSGKVRLEREPVSLLRLIEDAAVIWASDIRDKGLELSVMIDPALRAPRSADPARVLQIIGNLMANAIKFTTSGGVSIQAWPVKLHGGAERIEILVEDTGPGVPPEAAARIFSPFEQIDVSSKRRHGGLGIGLYVARRLAIAMGGDVELHSQGGEGSRFTVRFEAPLADAAPAASAGRAETAPAVRDVLCIDDNPRNLYVLGAMLRAAGHKIVECGSGEEALEALGRKRFDVVLLDMVMPGMDGLDVLARLRGAEGPNRKTRVIACTANVLPEQVSAYLEAGASSVLPKPIDIKSMLEAVGAAA
ncbi:MAG: response regulator [Alphaproteobacteria bacterium]|nr:response regulator [Alphaproteobacteria bacterium]